ncbi:MAG: sugar-binding protein [Firmicutes bacterium]|nr:sugar-binding protein [Bacillota bacterium]MDD4263683.1 sugar-binding protein [Bacillota bacterium]MDD4693699.1 sugar-binding protein [Bacillota bacterium]
MKRYLSLLLVLSVLIVIGVIASANDILTAPFVKRAPVLDGVLDDEAWKIAAEKGGKSEIAYYLNAIAMSEGKSDVYICWDDDYLYIAFQNYQPQDTIVAETFNDGGSIWVADDDNEIFISTTFPGSSPYKQGITNAIGTRAGMDGNLDWEVSAEIYDEYWITEIAIPFDIFNVYPDHGDEWAINLTRRSANDAGGPAEWRTWSSLPVTTFLDPLVFGLLEFVR